MNCDHFLDILLPLQPVMQLTAEKMLHSAEDAEDVVQDTFIGLWESRRKLQHVQNLESYAVQAVKNRCISQLRKRKNTVSLADIANLQYDDTAAEVALVEERARTIDHLMEQLPAMQRQAVQLRYIEHLSHEEMQQRLKMSSSNVYTILSRAISALKAMSHGR